MNRSILNRVKKLELKHKDHAPVSFVFKDKKKAKRLHKKGHTVCFFTIHKEE